MDLIGSHDEKSSVRCRDLSLIGFDGGDYSDPVRGEGA